MSRSPLSGAESLNLSLIGNYACKCLVEAQSDSNLWPIICADLLLISAIKSNPRVSDAERLAENVPATSL